MIRLTATFLAVLVLSAGLAAAEVDTSPMPIESVRAFPNLTFERPLLLTHAGDGSDRVFVASQLGQIHVFPNDQEVSTASAYLDIRDRVMYKDAENEEGLLGLAFHPEYAKNGQFFVYYTTREKPHLSVISRFRVSADDPNRADPQSEEVIMRIQQPFWNHNGGTIVFGPDGYLYIGLGDGGLRDDMFGNGQNLSTLLASILRIDVDHRDGDRPYAIPSDNPFRGAKASNGKDACEEIWAYGLRNVWRFSFDRRTDVCWAADVGQDTWEEINLIERGGNYGWNAREGRHRFGPKGSEPRDDLIEPIWEYNHALGKSITGGHVYRGERLPKLVGWYLYADYVSGQVWALKYDAETKQVVANRTIRGNEMPVTSFGEDQSGDVYFTTDVGKVHRFQVIASGESGLQKDE